MTHYVYRGEFGVRVPGNVTSATVAMGVEVIRARAFMECQRLVSIVMVDTVTIIELHAFRRCISLKHIRFSRALTHIGPWAFHLCSALEVLFLPRSVTHIADGAFMECTLLKLFVLSKNINPTHLGRRLVDRTRIQTIAGVNGVWQRHIHNFLIHHMDDAPLHKLCLDPGVSKEAINDYLQDHGEDSALVQDSTHGMLPLHLLIMNPHAEDAAICRVFGIDMDTAFRFDVYNKTPWEYAAECSYSRKLSLMSELMRLPPRQLHQKGDTA